jgi:hypothetical protein
MTDIVARLRARQGGGDDEEVLMREAADEIERLRKELEHQRNETKRYREILTSLRVEWVD